MNDNSLGLIAEIIGGIIGFIIPASLVYFAIKKVAKTFFKRILSFTAIAVIESTLFISLWYFIGTLGYVPIVSLLIFLLFAMTWEGRSVKKTEAIMGSKRAENNKKKSPFLFHSSFFKVGIFLMLAFIMGLIYWFGIQPTIIKRNCYQKALSIEQSRVSYSDKNKEVIMQEFIHGDESKAYQMFKELGWEPTVEEEELNKKVKAEQVILIQKGEIDRAKRLWERFGVEPTVSEVEDARKKVKTNYEICVLEQGLR